MNIYVGNLSREMTEEELQELFTEFGQVTSSKVIKDHMTGESRGFGFVEMADKEEAATAMDSLNGKEVKGRELVVNEARPKRDRRGGGGNDRRFNNNRNKYNR